MNNIFTISWISFAFFLFGCQHGAERLWLADLDEGTVYQLNSKTAEIKQHLDAMRERQKRGQESEASDAYRQAMQSLDMLQSYYIPLANAKGHVSAAFHIAERGNYTICREELIKARAQLALAQTKAQAAAWQNIDSVAGDIVEIENSLTRMDDQKRRQFCQIAQKINKLLV